MIAYLEGQVLAVGDHELTLVINGVGYLVHVPARLLERLQPGQTLQLFTHQYVREDAHELFGFTDRADLGFFQQLIQVAGVGPRLALAVLSQFPSDEVKRAIIHGDVPLLTSVSGVGKKTAERIVLDLKESITVTDEIAAAPAGAAPQALTAVDALTSLGYSKAEALQALVGADSEATVEDQVRSALRQLSRPTDTHARR
jgi:Holliday junction DNA helicase RuvA